MCPYLSANYVSDCPPNMAQVSVRPDNLQTEQTIQKDYKNLQGRSAVLDCVGRDREGRETNVEM